MKSDNSHRRSIISIGILAALIGFGMLTSLRPGIARAVEPIMVYLPLFNSELIVGVSRLGAPVEQGDSGTTDNAADDAGTGDGNGSGNDDAEDGDGTDDGADDGEDGDDVNDDDNDDVDDNDGDDSSDDGDTPPAGTPVTVEQARAIAEAANPGTTAVEVNFEQEDGTQRYEVELNNGLEVMVDATSGEIISSVMDD